MVGGTSRLGEGNRPLASVVPDQSPHPESEKRGIAIAKRPVWSNISGVDIGHLAAFVVASYVFLKMFYVFNEGLAQPADIGLAAIGLLIAKPSMILDFMKRNIILFVLLGWIATVNIVWVALTGKLNIATPILYYMFNAVVAMVVYAVRPRNAELFDRYVIYAIRAAAVFQLGALMLDDNFRPLGTFQNPNQLAYWGVVILSLYLLIRRNQSNWLDLPFLLILAYCVIASLSRAGAIAVLLLLSLWFWIVMKAPMKRALGALVGLMIMLVASQTGYIENFLSKSETVENFEFRDRIDHDKSTFEERNYDRIVEYYEYTLFGAGEGYYTRFEPANVLAVEIHSSFGTMLFSYGVIGLLLFCTFMWNVLRSLPLALSWYLVPSLLYGITHQGLRFSFFWVLIGIMLAMGQEFRQQALQRDDKGPRSGRMPKPGLVTLRPRLSRGPQELRMRASGGNAAKE